MSKNKKINEIFEGIRNVKMGLLKLSYASAAHGKTIKSNGEEYSVPAFGRKLASDVESLTSDLRSGAVLADSLVKENALSGTFSKPLMYMDNLKQALLKISNTVEGKQVAIVMNNKCYSVIEYEHKLLSDIEIIESSVKSEALNLQTALSKKFTDGIIKGNAHGPISIIK